MHSCPLNACPINAGSEQRAWPPFDGTPIAPLRALLDAPDSAVLAILSDIDGPSYRPLGAMMTLVDESRRIGALSSGCIEGDIALQAVEARKSAVPQTIRYGAGSPYADLPLPCGGGLEVLLLPRANRVIAAQVLKKYHAREACTLVVNTDSGSFALGQAPGTRRRKNRLDIRVEPAICFQIFGKGPEACAFAALVQASGYPNVLLSPERETLEFARRTGCPTRHIASPVYPSELHADSRTAIAMFFHEHDWEPPILLDALGSPAFYVGVQGSHRVAKRRRAALRDMGVGEAALQRLYSPVGLIPSARDPRTLAVSVLAQALCVARNDKAGDATRPV